MAVLAGLGCIQFLVTRACGYDLVPVIKYAGYLVSHVCLPGVVVVAALHRGPISLTTAIALGVPTGFAVEIFSFLGLSAAGLKGFWWLLPIVSLAGAAILFRRWGASPVRWRVTVRHAGVALGTTGLVLATVVAAASHMFAESPLVAGLPQRPIFHDWVYLVSRAASIKNHWPLEDPSLLGVSLHYHYFMLVHAASASWVTGIELTQVLLRLVVIPLGAVLVVQAYALGRQISRTPWGGVIAGLLTVAVGEMAFATDANHSVFLGRFVRWLHVSPTFYFGMIFFGAALLGFAGGRTLPRSKAWHVAWIGLMAAATTGAKGTVMPVLLVALGLVMILRWVRSGRFPTRLAVTGAVMAAAFTAVYHLTMSQWGTGAAAFAPFDVLQLSEAWQQEFSGSERWFAHWMPDRIAPLLTALIGGGVVLAGTEGVRLFAIPFLLTKHPATIQPLVEWLGAVLFSSAAMGLMMKLDADGELYLLLLMQLPGAVLASAFVMGIARQVRATWVSRRIRATPLPKSGILDELTARAGTRSQWAVPLIVVVSVMVIGPFQIGMWWKRNARGFAEWMRSPPTNVMSADMQYLREALLWVRQHTERDAVLMTNACTPANLKKDHWGALDGTLVGVHYYYSALSERRLWVEGPHYLLDPVKVSQRVELAGRVFHGNQPPTSGMIGVMPAYALIDRNLRDAAKIALVASARVFANPRIEIYRLPRQAQLSERATGDGIGP